MPITDANKDEAERFFDIAVEAYTNGDLEKAEKYFLKADELLPTEYVKDIISKIRERKNGNTDPDNTAEQTEADYTTEQMEAVRKVKNCKDFYEILGVNKTATDSEIKKAYKKLALQLHPDKNRAPGALEAFKAVANAAAILADPVKRQQYDAHGFQPENQDLFVASDSFISLSLVLLGGAIAGLSIGYLLNRLFSSKPTEGNRCDQAEAGGSVGKDTPLRNGTKK
ncbi:dnaJ homolog subfamily B member 12-like [Musca vetustissima]|uniref:dnaJ homolog subfamily B member 12-like n=1 Tax=Musca vetustissima TaxID=27455 RepID=UPI002AB7D791|nr:dnaJ homolog subfamily B member 12-like [Musca vetustissima]